jgi:leucyl aminopeptidase
MRIEIARARPNDHSVAIIPLVGRTDTLPATLDERERTACEADIAAVDFRAGPGEVLDISSPPGSFFSRILLIGVAAGADRPTAGWEQLGGQLPRQAARLCADAMTVIMPASLPSGLSVRDAVASIALGASLTAPADNPYRTWSKEREPSLKQLTMVVPDDGGDLADAIREVTVVAEAVRETRRRIMAPPNVMTPRALIAEAETLRDEGIIVETFLGDDALEQQFPGTRAVGSGSAEESGAAIMAWMGAGADKPVSLAISAKGVTFDSGGLTPKGEFDQRLMKIDMCGASSAIAVMDAIARLKLPINVVAGFGAVENLSGGAAFKSGDILRMANGTYVEVTYPDAEGRLVMADMNCYLADRYDPAMLINLAALTYTAVSALGDDCIALFANDDGLSDSIMRASKQVGEVFWRLPIGPRYQKLLTSDIADMKNMVAANQWGLLAGSASAASEFLHHFAGKRKWANLDIFAAIWRAKDHELGPAGATGEPVRTLIRLLQAEARGNQAPIATSSQQ